MKKVANPVDDRHWMRTTDGRQYQLAVNHEKKSSRHSLPSLHTFSKVQIQKHDTFIYLLAKMGINAGFKVHVGKKEQAAGKVNGELLKDLSLKKIPQIEKRVQYSRKLMEQVDLIWFDDENTAVACFEIENTTKVEKTFDRFHELIGLYPQVKQENRCFVIAHKDNVNRLLDKLTVSHWIGYPHFMERAASFMTFDEFIKLYSSFDGAKKHEPHEVLRRLQSAATRCMYEVSTINHRSKIKIT